MQLMMKLMMAQMWHWEQEYITMGSKRKEQLKKKTVVDSMGKVYLSINMVAYKLFVYSMGVFPE